MLVESQRYGNVAILLLNNPREYNNLSSQLVVDMLNALSSEPVNKARAIVIGGTGTSFCAGANIKDLLEQGWMEGRNPQTSPVTLFRRLLEDPRPVIAAVDGMALGGGVELALSCDLALASDRATFSLPEARHGVIPNTALALLTEQIGRRRALEWIMTAKRASAQEALQWGFVNKVVAPDVLLDEAVRTAEDIVSSCAPGALREIKNSMNRHSPLDWDEINNSLARLPPEQWQEGLSAFLERREPDYNVYWNKDS